MNNKDILKPITGAHAPIGQPDTATDAFMAVDTEIMRIGSLQHGSIDWEVVHSQSIRYLVETCKDYKVLGFLTKYVLQSKDQDMVSDFIDVFVQFNAKYLFAAFPAPVVDKATSAPAIKGAKAKSLQLIIDSFGLFYKKEVDSVKGLPSTESLLKNLATLQTQLSSNQRLASRVETMMLAINNRQAQQSAAGNGQGGLAGNRGTENLTDLEAAQAADGQPNAPVAEPIPTSQLGFASDRETRSSYLMLARHCNQTTPESSLGYHLRRYAIWYGITSLPACNAEHITQMTAVPLERIAEYRNAVVNAPNQELLIRIEKTLENSPFWIEGNQLAYLCAKAIGYHEVGELIQHQTRRFVGQFKLFAQMKFSCGNVFLTEETTQWLEDISSVTQVVQGGTSSAELQKHYEQGGLAAVFKYIDSAYQSPLDKREQYGLRLEKLGYLIQEGLQDMAAVELAELVKLAKEHVVTEWEPSFFNKIDATVKQLERL